MARRIGIVLTIAVLAALIFSVQGAGAVTVAEKYQEIQNTIDGGIHWLIDQQHTDGSWGGEDFKVAKTGYAILKLMDRSRELGEGDPLTGTYGPEIQAGLNFLFTKVQGADVRDPGSIWDVRPSPYDPCEGTPPIVYETSIAIMAIANTRTPDAKVPILGSPVDGWTYKQVVEDAVNYLEKAQVPNDVEHYGIGYGGWYLYDQSQWVPKSCPTGKYSDQMNSGYAVQALAYARDTRNGFNIGITAESFQDLTYWVTGIQDVAAGGAYDCISDPDFGCMDPRMNIWQTGDLLIQQRYLGYEWDQPEVNKSIAYIGNNWGESPPVGWQDNVQAMYAATAGLQAFDNSSFPVDGEPHDWFADFENRIVDSKVPGGIGEFYWNPDYGTGDEIHSTELTLNTLEGWVYPAHVDVIVVVTPDVISPGDQATCTVEVTNNGETAVYGLDITEFSDTGTTFGLSEVEPVITNGDTDDILEPGETWTYTKDTDIPGSLTDTITVSGEDIRGREVKEERTVTILVSQDCGTAELCGDGIDNNCDGSTDEGFNVGEPCSVGTGACKADGHYVCSANGLTTVCDAVEGPATTELCGDSVDNDCDGSTDEGFNVGQDCSVGTGACKADGHYVCGANGLSTVCDAVEGPATTELCGDSVDNDCDGAMDEDCGCTGTAGYWLNHPCVLDKIFATTDGGCGYTFSVGEDGVQVLSTADARKVLGLDPGACARCERIMNKKTVASENPLNQLYRQTLAAELAIHDCTGDNAANPTAVQATLSAAEAFLNEHSCDAGCLLREEEKAQVSTWNAMLDQFNSGTLAGGPLECTTFPCKKT
jgi:hypothetical protein